MEPGTTPASNIQLGPFPKFDDWSWACGLSRLYAGVHFKDSILESKRICESVGEYTYHYVQTLINGTWTESNSDSEVSQNDSESQ